CPSHGWIARWDAEHWRIGLTKFAVRMLGDMVDHGFETEPGASVQPGQVVGWIEGFKAISDLFCIAQGTFAGVNPPLKDKVTTDHGPRTADKARYIMIGGFLGAGKTTAVARLAQRLTDQGVRVGLITNDQGSDLVDTAMLRARGFATEEIPGGCFCCRFNSLVDAAERLTTATRPDVFIAEPVGSCTDLVATVTYPLRRIYSDDFAIAPLSVLVDPIRALRVFGLETGGKFSGKVLYIYRKQ